MCTIELDPCSVWEDERPVARKPHTCDCCGAAIVVGERYLSHFSVYEGDPNRESGCAACDADITAFSDEHSGTRCAPWTLRELLHECLDNSDGDENDAKWREMLDRIKSRSPVRAANAPTE